MYVCPHTLQWRSEDNSLSNPPILCGFLGPDSDLQVYTVSAFTVSHLANFGGELFLTGLDWMASHSQSSTYLCFLRAGINVSFAALPGNAICDCLAVCV